jgi:hypothetical protein
LKELSPEGYNADKEEYIDFVMKNWFW